MYTVTGSHSPVEKPERGERVSQVALLDTVQFRVPPPEFLICRVAARGEEPWRQTK
jgi:hypothetical protein